MYEVDFYLILSNRSQELFDQYAKYEALYV